MIYPHLAYRHVWITSELKPRLHSSYNQMSQYAGILCLTAWLHLGPKCELTPLPSPPSWINGKGWKEGCKIKVEKLCGKMEQRWRENMTVPSYMQVIHVTVLLILLSRTNTSVVSWLQNARKNIRTTSCN